MLTYRRYLEADRAWSMALEELKGWFPLTNRPGPSVIGNPGSPIRRLYERREQALLQMQVARRKLEVAKQRLVTKHENTRGRQILLVSYQAF
ncbi:hypothetical protein ROS217_15340 [Roseovarius sp. 217]|nr:hypothetical protein ROS217_15340 [Roseovarius sp. 217]